MFRVSDVLKKYDLKPKMYRKENNAYVVDTDKGMYVVKEKNRDNNYIFDYLKSRNFNYYPRIINKTDDDFVISEYVDSLNIPLEQKILDVIDLVSLLHYKTTHYKEVTIDYYKEIYEDIGNNIEYLKSYYLDMITIIESHVYMSPSEYLVARNISKINASLDFAAEALTDWYALVKTKTKQRMVVLHNNLEMDHYIYNDNPYLISWDKSKIDSPIYDLYKLYKRNVLKFDFSDIFNRYESKYPLNQDEKELLYILLILPDKLEFTDNEYYNSKKASEMIDALYKTEMLISPYYSKKREKYETQEQK